MYSKIDNLTLGEIHEIVALFGTKQQTTSCDNPYPIGKNIFIRTVTHHHTGRLVQVTQQELVLEDASWIADDGRFTDALQTGNFHEVEMFPKGRVIIGREAIIDVVEIETLPTEQK